MSFRAYIPSDILKPYIHSFSIQENDMASSYKVLPGTSIVMGFQYSGKLAYSNEDRTTPLSVAGITGLLNRYRIFTNSEFTGTVLVMFNETGAASFFNHSMHELFNESISLDDLILHSQMDMVVEKLCEAKNDLQRIEAVEQFLISRLSSHAKDPAIEVAVKIIKQNNGNIRMTELCSQLNITQSRLEKRFRKIVGTSPKKFSSLVRIRSIIDSPSNTESLVQLGLESGYFDQAHFIKDFKSFTGETPEKFFIK